MDPTIILRTLLLGAMYGGLAAALGYLKGKEIPDFDGVVFVRTILIGAFLGFIVQSESVFGLDLSQMKDGLLFTAIVALFERIAVLVWRRLVEPLIQWLIKVTEPKPEA